MALGLTCRGHELHGKGRDGSGGWCKVNKLPVGICRSMQTISA